MARKAATSNGHDRLEEAMALLIQNQAAFVGRLAETDRAHTEFERRNLEYQRESTERFARIEAQIARIEVQMAEVIRVLNEHNRILERMPEIIRDKIGFKPPQ